MDDDFWRNYLQLIAHFEAVEAERHQGTAYNPTSQSHQSLHAHQYSDTTLVSEHQATYVGYATTNHYSQAPRYDLTDSGQSQANIGSNATDQPPCNVSSDYHHCSDYLPTHNLGLSDTNLTNSSSSTSVHEISFSSAAGWPTHNATIIKSYHGLSDDPNTYNFSDVSDTTHHQATHGGGPPINNYGQVHRDDLPFREISRDGIGRAARWSPHNRTPAHSHNGFADHSSAHSTPGNLPDDDIPSFTQAMYVYGGGLAMNSHAQAPRDDLHLISGDTLGFPHSIDRGINQHGIQSAAGWPPGSAPSSTVLSSYSSAHAVTVAGHLQNYTIPNGTQHQAACPTTDNHPVYPVNDRRSESRADGRTSVCEWNGDNGPCGKTVNVRRECIRAHISSDHLEPHLPANHLVKCRWKDCRGKQYLRRDTIARHVAEVHFGMKRSESGGARAMVP